MTHTLAFEIIGEMFRRDTGLLRPGKSYPLEMTRPEDLDLRFKAWSELNLNHIRAVLSFIDESFL